MLYKRCLKSCIGSLTSQAILEPRNNAQATQRSYLCCRQGEKLKIVCLVGMLVLKRAKKLPLCCVTVSYHADFFVLF